MSKMCAIVGPPASGKTTGCRFLDPKETFIINADGKELSWVGAGKTFNAENKNYFATSDLDLIAKSVVKIHDTRPDIKVVVIDTINTPMSDEEMRILTDPSRDQWADLAVGVYNLFRIIRQLKREDLLVFVMMHSESYEADGITKWRLKTNGKKLTKLNLSGFLSYSLWTEVDWSGEAPVYHLVTQNTGNTEARSPMGVFETLKIENNLKMVADKILSN